MSIIFFILTFILVVVFFIIAIFSKILSSLFGGFKKTKGQSYQDFYGDRSNQSRSASSEPKNDNKVFTKEEGEYVSFEEVE